MMDGKTDKEGAQAAFFNIFAFHTFEIEGKGEERKGKKKKKMQKKKKKKKNKPDRATMRPGCVSACINHVTYVWRYRWMNRRVKRLSKHLGRSFVSV